MGACKLHAHGMPCAAHKALAMVECGGSGRGSVQAQVEGDIVSCSWFIFPLALTMSPAK